MVLFLLAAAAGSAAELRNPRTRGPGATNDPPAIPQAFNSLQGRGYRDAHLLDAASEAIQRLNERDNTRRVLLLIGESRDRGSKAALAEVLLEAQRGAVSIYSISFSACVVPFASKPEDIPPSATVNDFIAGISDLIRLGKTKTFTALTQPTGGAQFSFARQKALESEISRIGAELHSQYILSFTPPPGATGYRQIAVRVNRPGEFVVRARAGYWAQ